MKYNSRRKAKINLKSINCIIMNCNTNIVNKFNLQTNNNNYLKPGPSKVGLEDRFSCSFFLFASGKKHFHIRKVSSAPAERTVEPSGDMAKFRIRLVCPVSSATLKVK